MEDLEPFYPARMAGRVLGMGDVLSFVEKAQEVVSIDQLIACYLCLFIFLMDHGLMQLLLKLCVDAPRRC